MSQPKDRRIAQRVSSPTQRAPVRACVVILVVLVVALLGCLLKKAGADDASWSGGSDLAATWTHWAAVCVVLILLTIGAAIFFQSKSKQAQRTVLCSQCRSQISALAQVCPSCGSEFKSESTS